jgi:hypothetical protein
VILECAEAEEPAEKCQRMIGKGLVYERMLPVNRFRCAAPRLRVVIEAGIHDLRKLLCDGSQAQDFSAITLVQRLPKGILAGLGTIPDVHG